MFIYMFINKLNQFLNFIKKKKTRGKTAVVTTELDFLLLYNLEVQLLKIGGTRGTNRGWQKELSAI